MADAFSFEAQVALAGHEWIKPGAVLDTTIAKGVDNGSPIFDTFPVPPPGLVLVSKATGLQAFRTYYPLRDHSGLFRIFAGLPVDKESIVRFANEYGFLNARFLSTQEMPGCHCEPFCQWGRLIKNMKVAVQLFDLLAAGDATGVRNLLLWDDKPRPSDLSAARGPQMFPAHSAGDCQDLTSALWFLVYKNDYLRSGDDLIEKWVNFHLNGKTQARLVRHLDGSRLIQVVPDSLFFAMWLQLAQAIAGNRKHRQCKECDRWFEISPVQSDRRTVRRLFCSDQCKSRDYRRRREKVAILAAAGKAAKEIANEVETELDTIKKWMNKRNKR